MTYPHPLTPALLERSFAERLNYFKSITVPHQRLRQAVDSLLLNIQQPADISVFFVVGPTGVGKTTLRLRAEKILSEASISNMLACPCQIPVAGVEAIAAERGNFSYKDYYLRVLESLNNIWINSILASKNPSLQIKELGQSAYLQRKNSDVVRRALEKVMQHHQLMALMIDEAQHLLLMAGGRQMLQQMNWIKSIANVTGTVHILFGTYDLLNCCTLSGQVSRRSEDIHLSRYSTHKQEDIAEFIRIIQTFQMYLPLHEQINLAQRYEYLMDYSIGCAGILKTWLTKALRSALAEESKTLTWKHIQQNEYSPARRKQIRSEAEAGEKRWRNEVASEVGVEPELSNKVQNDTKSTLKKRRVGQRQPKRDSVGANSYVG